MARTVKDGIIIRIHEKIESGAKYEYRNKTKFNDFKCTICGRKWRRFSGFYFTEHLEQHIANGDKKETDIYEGES